MPLTTKITIQIYAKPDRITDAEFAQDIREIAAVAANGITYPYDIKPVEAGSHRAKYGSMGIWDTNDFCRV